MMDKYLTFRNLPECDISKHGRAQWEDNYPNHGLDFYIWKQENKKGDSACSGGIYQQASDTCYRYKKMTNICLLVKFKHDPERNTYSWFYTGGCFKGGEAVNYEDAKPGEHEDFKKVPIQLRLDHRDFADITIIKEDEDDEDVGANPNNSLTPEGRAPPKETDAKERFVRREKSGITNWMIWPTKLRVCTYSINSLCSSLVWLFSWLSSASPSLFTTLSKLPRHHLEKKDNH